LNGEIVIESNPRQGPGTKVVIKLVKHDLNTEETPVQSVNEPKASYYQLTDFKTDDSEYSPNRHTILLVEDNKAMLNFLITKLRKKYNIYSALNGADGIKKLRELPVVPDLILSDIMMDKMDGFSFAKIISEQPKYSHIPFVFLTAKSTGGHFKNFNIQLKNTKAIQNRKYAGYSQLEI
jgi:CheY-like chemotaxis protein